MTKGAQALRLRTKILLMRSARFRKSIAPLRWNAGLHAFVTIYGRGEPPQHMTLISNIRYQYFNTSTIGFQAPVKGEQRDERKIEAK